MSEVRRQRSVQKWYGQRYAIATLSVLFLVALTLPAQAGDRRGRKADAIDSSITSDPAILVNAESTRRGFSENERPSHRAPNNFFVTNEMNQPRFVRDRNAKRNKDEEKSEPRSAKERKQIRFFHFNSKLGEVSVSPVIGSINGAQMSVGF